MVVLQQAVGNLFRTVLSIPLAVGLNYRSHLGERQPAAYPGLFAKYPTSIVGPDADIVLPPDAGNVHYEGELVIVIGKPARRVAPKKESKGRRR